MPGVIECGQSAVERLAERVSGLALFLSVCYSKAEQALVEAFSPHAALLIHGRLFITGERIEVLDETAPCMSEFSLSNDEALIVS